MSRTNIVNESLFDEEEDHHEIPMQMGFNIPFPPNMTLPPLGCHDQSLKGNISAMSSSLSPQPPNFSQTLLATVLHKPRQFEDLTSTFGGGSHLLSLNRSGVNSW